MAVHASTVKPGHSTIPGFEVAMAPNGLEVAMCIAATTDAQPVKHRPKIKEIGTEMIV